MTRTERLYQIVKDFRAEVLAKDKELTEREKALSDLKGSPRYHKIIAQIENERADNIDSVRDKLAPETDVLMHKCLEATAKTVPTEAPTEEALRTLEVLKLRSELAHKNGEAVPSEEIHNAVKAMGDNPTALEALRSIATENGVMLLTPSKKGITQAQAQEAVKLMARSINTIYHLPKLGIREEYGKMMNGYESDITNGHASDAYRLDMDFNSEDEFLQGMTFVSAENIPQLKEILNQE